MARRAGHAARLFLELLHPGKPRGDLAATAEDLREAAALAHGHGLFLLVDRRIRERAESFSAGLAADGYEKTIRPLRARHISHAVRYEREEGEVLALLEAAAVPSVILKGSALSRELYGDRHCRTSGDIDLLVRPGDLLLADAALREAGYRRDNEQPLSFWVRRLHHAVYQRPGSRFPVEVHWNFSIPGFFDLDPAEIWAGVAHDGLRGHLDPAMTLTLLLMHHHLHGCAALRTLVDLAWALEQRRGEPGPGCPPGHLERIGLLVVAGIARRQAAALWGTAPRELAEGGSRHGLRVRLLASVAGLALQPGRPARARDRFLHALVQRLGLDAPRRVIASVSKTILPPSADLRALFGGERSGLPGYVRYFRWRLGGRAAGGAGKGRPQL